MKFDKVMRGDPANGQTGEIQLPPVQAELDRLGQAIAAARLDDAITAVTMAMAALKPLDRM